VVGATRLSKVVGAGGLWSKVLGAGARLLDDRGRSLVLEVVRA
jgi:hypothetical protein